MRRKSLTMVACSALMAVAMPVAASSVLGIAGVSSAGPCSENTPVASGLGDPFGSLDGNGVTGGNAGAGAIKLIGWALDDNGVAAVDILVDGRTAGRAAYGLRRGDVSKVFPGFPDSALPGFEYQLDSTRWPNGKHQVSAIVVSNTGEERQLNTIGLDFSNNAHDLRPFGQIEFPQRDAQLFGNCDLALSRSDLSSSEVDRGAAPPDPERRYWVVEGWALDLGADEADAGVGYVELLIDGAIYANSRLNCRHSTTTGAYTNCYGKRRQDIESQYPFAVDAPNAGFRFVIDVGLLVASGYSEGQHILTVRVGDVRSQVSNIDTTNVVFLCQDRSLDEGSIGAIDLISDIRSGALIDLSGWALDADGVTAVKIFVDGRQAGLAAYGFPRLEVTSQYPGFPDSATPGWLFSLDTSSLANGEHVVTALVVDDDDFETLIGEARFLTSN